MAQFKVVNLFQMRLLPTDPRKWIEDNDLIFFINGILDELNLNGFYEKYRPDNWGGKGYDPKVMLIIIMMGYCNGTRESRRIRELCKTDIRLRSLLGDEIPDHSTISRFIRKFSTEIENLFEQVTDLLIKENIIDTTVFAIDGTKMRANASMQSNKSLNSILKTIESLQEKIVKSTENMLNGLNSDQPINRLPIQKIEEQLSRYEQAKEIIENRHAEDYDEYQKKLTERNEIECRTGKKIRGRKLTPVSKETNTKLKCNTSDPQSVIQKGKIGFVQGFNAQITVSKNHFIIAANLVADQNDLNQLLPMVNSIVESFLRNDLNPQSTVLLADAGYCVYQNMPEIFEHGFDLYIPSQKEYKIPSNVSNELFALAISDISIIGLNNIIPCVLATYGEYVYREWMNDELDWDYNKVIHDLMAIKMSSPSGRENYRKRKWIVESIFGYLKEGMKILAFLRRGLDRCRSEWKFICTCYNLKRAWKKGFSSRLLAE